MCLWCMPEMTEVSAPMMASPAASSVEPKYLKRAKGAGVLPSLQRVPLNLVFNFAGLHFFNEMGVIIPTTGATAHQPPQMEGKAAIFPFGG